MTEVSGKMDWSLATWQLGSILWNGGKLWGFSVYLEYPWEVLAGLAWRSHLGFLI